MNEEFYFSFLLILPLTLEQAWKTVNSRYSCIPFMILEKRQTHTIYSIHISLGTIMILLPNLMFAYLG